MRPTQNNLTAQPFVIFNLPEAFYLRSTATWNFDMQRGTFYIPLGFGGGKIWKLESGTTFNLFAEPQVTVAHDGVTPKFQLFFGLNMQFPDTEIIEEIVHSDRGPKQLRKAQLKPNFCQAKIITARTQGRLSILATKHWNPALRCIEWSEIEIQARRPGSARSRTSAIRR